MSVLTTITRYRASDDGHFFATIVTRGSDIRTAVLQIYRAHKTNNRTHLIQEMTGIYTDLVARMENLVFEDYKK